MSAPGFGGLVSDVIAAKPWRSRTVLFALGFALGVFYLKWSDSK